MTELSQTILTNHEIRKTKKQKQAFIDLMQSHFPQMQIQKRGKTRNLILGNVEKASVVLSAHYDTGARLLFPGFVAPKSHLINALYSLLTLLPAFLGVVIVNIVLHFIGADFLTRYMASVVTACILISLKFIGPANRHNMNDNTSGVITLCELMVNLSVSEKRKVAFVFFDREETGMQGSALFYRQHRKIMKNKLLVNLDCVSDGDHILVAATKEARKHYGTKLDDAFLPTAHKSILLEHAERIYYPSDHRNFPCSAVIGALRRKHVLGYYLGKVHTHRDTVMDKTNIKLLCDSILRLLRAL